MPHDETPITSTSPGFPDISTQGVKGASVLALAVILLEIHLGRSIQSDLQEASHLIGVVIDLLITYQAEMSDDYRAAIAFCLFPHQSKNDFETGNFREEYFKSVMARLESCLQNTCDLPSKFWVDMSCDYE